MKTEEIQQRLDDIKVMAGDDESAHSAEDRLMRDFIAYVATLNEALPNLALKAKLVLTSKEIEFERWCA